MEKILKKHLTCLGENTSKYIHFAVSIEHKFARIEINEEKLTKNISYRLEIIERSRLIASSLSSFADNLSEGIRRIKCKIQTRRLKT